MKEKLRNVNGLRTEVEDLSGCARGVSNESIVRRQGEGVTHLTEDSGEAGESDTENVHSQGVYDHVGVIFEGHASSRDILSSLCDA